MPSVKKAVGTNFSYSSSVNRAYGEAPLLCHVSSTKSSLRITPPHFSHFSVIRSTQGLCNSKLSGIGSWAFSMSSFLLAIKRLFAHFSQVHIGKGVPQMRSRLMHHGLPSFRNPRKRFLGSSKKYSIFSAASSTLLLILSVRKKYSFLANQTSL